MKGCMGGRRGVIFVVDVDENQLVQLTYLHSGSMVDELSSEYQLVLF